MFNGFLKVAFQGSTVTSDAGLILVRELDERLGLEAIIAAHLRDSRHGLNTQFRLPDLLRQSVYSRLAGYEDLNDAQRLSTDPTVRLIGSPTRWDRSAALTSTLHWFETELLTRDDNLVGLMAVNRDLIGRAETCDRSDRTVLDMDSSESPVHGQQEGSAYNGHFASVCYHPLFLFTDHGDCVAAKLRPGNVSSADDWDELLAPEIDRQQVQGKRVAFRADAAFARPAIYEALEARGVQYAIRIPANKNLELAIEDVLFRSPGRPSRTPLVRYKSVQYQADSWTTPRRVVAKVEHHVGELFPRVGFIVTNLPLPNRAVVRFYNKRGTAEQWIKEGKQAAHWTRLSCHRFRRDDGKPRPLRLDELRTHERLTHFEELVHHVEPVEALRTEELYEVRTDPQTSTAVFEHPFMGLHVEALHVLASLLLSSFPEVLLLAGGSNDVGPKAVVRLPLSDGHRNALHLERGVARVRILCTEVLPGAIAFSKFLVASDHVGQRRRRPWNWLPLTRRPRNEIEQQHVLMVVLADLAKYFAGSNPLTCLGVKGCATRSNRIDQPAIVVRESLGKIVEVVRQSHDAE